MNKKLEDAMEEFPLINYDDVEFLHIDVTHHIIEDDDVYTVQMAIVNAYDDELKPINRGLVFQTGIIENTMQNVADRVKLLVESQTFSHLQFVDDFVLLDEDTGEMSELLWSNFKVISEE